MTSEQIITDFFYTLPEDQKFPAVNYFLSLFVIRHIETMPQKMMEQLLLTIQPIDETSTKALSLLEKRLFELFGIS